MSTHALSGRVALVAGAGRGIGRDIAMWLSQAGAAVIVCSRTRDEIGAVADEIRENGGTAVAAVCDVADSAALRDVVDRAIAEFGHIDIAVACAAMLGPVGPVSEVSHDAWLQTLTVNVGGTVAVVRAVLPSMAARGYGRVLTMSGAGVGGPNMASRVSAYAASKGAVMVLTEALAAEMPAGVTINSIAPGPVPTKFMDEVRRVGPDVAGQELFDAAMATTRPDSRPLHELVIYLASEESAWLNGRCLSARWEHPSSLSALGAIAASRFRLRRIDEDLYGELSAR